MGLGLALQAVDDGTGPAETQPRTRRKPEYSMARMIVKSSGTENFLPNK
ncbi:hypothetical protein [uncultured Megasphaera sp.]|nr:hypothetical protein [uncultured Megasphaera sp.]